jgi:ribosomal protein L12E/L44/L45/RPP1/RPP2
MTNNMTRRTFTAMAAVGAASALLGGCSQKQDEQRREEAPVEKEPLAVAIKATGWNDKDVWSALSAVPLPRKWDEKTKEADGEDPFADHKEPYEWATCSGEESVAALGDENTEYLVRAYAPVLADGTIFKDSPRYVVVRAGSEPASICFEPLEAKDMTDEAIASALAPFKADEKCLAALAAATAARMAAAKPAAPAEEAAPEAAPSAAQEATPQAAPSDGGGGSNAGGSGYEAPSGGSGGYTPPDSGDGGGDTGSGGGSITPPPTKVTIWWCSCGAEFSDYGSLMSHQSYYMNLADQQRDPSIVAAHSSYGSREEYR